jgi:ceramide glucosyltransferase
VPRPFSPKHWIVAREPDNSDGMWGGLGLPAFDLSQSCQYRNRGVRTRPRPTPLPPPRAATRVSVVRPLCGLDNFCEETLESSFQLDYPSFEIIFCVARASDPVLPLVERLIARHPGRPARGIVGDEQVSPNPKLNNCVRGWDAACYDWIILADANVLMPNDAIQRLLASWRSRTGLVCSMPLSSRPRNLWAELECSFLSTFEVRWQYCAKAVGLGFAQGKTMLWRREVMDKGGGIRALGAEIAEDAASTKLVRRQGLSVNLVNCPFEQPLGCRGFRDVWLRQVRWARMRRKAFPPRECANMLITFQFAVSRNVRSYSRSYFRTAHDADWRGHVVAFLIHPASWPFSCRYQIDNCSL